MKFGESDMRMLNGFKNQIRIAYMYTIIKIPKLYIGSYHVPLNYFSYAVYTNDDIINPFFVNDNITI